jgi:hypothetical protein
MGMKNLRSGQSLVEFALIAPLFFLLVFGIIDFGRLFFKLPGVNPDTSQPYTRVESIKAIAKKAAMGLDISAINVSSQNGGPGSAGGPGDRVTVSITYTLRLITPIIGKFYNNGQHTFVAQTTFRNEPFHPSQTN